MRLPLLLTTLLGALATPLQKRNLDQIQSIYLAPNSTFPSMLPQIWTHVCRTNAATFNIHTAASPTFPGFSHDGVEGFRAACVWRSQQGSQSDISKTVARHLGFGEVLAVGAFKQHPDGLRLYHIPYPRTQAERTRVLKASWQMICLLLLEQIPREYKFMGFEALEEEGLYRAYCGSPGPAQEGFNGTGSGLDMRVWYGRDRRVAQIMGLQYMGRLNA